MIGDHRLQGYLGCLPVHEAAAWKQKLEHQRTDCGCRVGAAVMLAGTATWIAYSILTPAAGQSWQRTTVSGLVMLSVSGLIGKLIGLFMARMRFYFTVRSLRRRACGVAAGCRTPG